MSELANTGERLHAPSQGGSPEDRLILALHLASYDWAVPQVRDLEVLDFGCGTGYGAPILAGSCRGLVAVDVDPSSIEFAREHYSGASIAFGAIRPVEDEPLPFDDGSFDCVVSFQVLEHVEDDDRYLAECRRVLRRRGLLLLATPNREARLFRWQRPWNGYHRREYSRVRLERTLRGHFAEVELSGLAATNEWSQLEESRVRRIRWQLAPLTLPIGPDAWRRAALRRLMALRNRRKNRVTTPMGPSGPTGDPRTATRIEPAGAQHPILLALARVTKGG